MAVAGTAALVGVAGVRAAAVTLLVVVVGAAGVGVKDQRAGKISRRSAVSLAGNAAAQPDTGLCQSHLCTAANAAAQQHIYAVAHQKAHQCAVALPIGGDHLGAGNVAFLDSVQLELRRVAEVLEHLTIFIRDCDLYTKNSFLCTRFSIPILTDCAEIGKGTRGFCVFGGGKHSRYVKMISETAAKCIIIEPEKRVQV